ncbi:ACDE family multidrug resistance protein [Scopulibacillus darangshiensis]|uniref:ACDE family multidrug resistance protein n=1 Tax=Scopulibacillus darangshiensis TaxID=442528 RepID=A0A4R2NY89_9BACL|nr:MFS transporter [Scopulibacillus darangshiensis]TCP27042.1 ACDE family multidrug resistance protein [Scopulibacillus darangshiensis]
MEDEKKTLDLISLASIPLMMTLGNSMLIPVLPTIEKKLDITAFQSSLIITVYSVVAIILIPIAGYLSDRIGRKKVIIPSLIISGAGGLVAGLAAWFIGQPYWLILLGRLLQGIGASGAFPVVIPLVGDLFKSEKDVSNGLGVVETSNTFGKVLSPIFGAFLAAFIWYLPFLVIPILCLISIILVALFVKAPKNQDESKPIGTFFSDIKSIFKEKWKWLLAVFFIGAIIMFVLFGTLFYLSELLESTYHIKAVRKGIVIAIPLFALSVSSYATGKKIGQNKRLMKWLTFVGMVLLAVGLFLLSFQPNIRLFLIYLFIGGVGIGLVLPCLDAFITEGIQKENRGTITSLYSSMRFIGVAAGPPLFAVMMDKSVMMMFMVAAAAAIIAGVLAFIAIKPKEKENASNEGNLTTV